MLPSVRGNSIKIFVSKGCCQLINLLEPFLGNNKYLTTIEPTLVNTLTF